MQISSSKPNFLIAGAARSGTTALARILAQHPDVFVCEPKEVHFYAHAGAEVTYRGAGDEEMINRWMVTDANEFYSLFENGASCARRGDGSVSTLFCSDAAVKNIQQYADPDCKVVVMLREPVARAYSSYLYLVSRGYERSESFAKALKEEPTRSASGYHHMWMYQAASRYKIQLEKFVDTFGDRLLVLIHEEFRQQPVLSLEKICNFMEVDAGFAFSTEQEVNSGGVPRNKYLTECVNRLRTNTFVKNFAKSISSQALRESVRHRMLKKPGMSAVEEQMLQGVFDEDVAYVESLLGRRIESWHK